jgi:molybdate transport system substrate-binding protein
MGTRWIAFRMAALCVGSILLYAGLAHGAEIKVMNSGGFAAAYRELAPEFERATQNTLVTSWGASMGTAPDTIPSRLERGEPVDVLIMAGSALDELIKKGKVIPGSRVDLARSGIGMAGRAGSPKPDISSVDAFKRLLLGAKSIAVSTSASGVYLTEELFPRLGIADQIMGKCKKVSGEPAGALVARGEVEIAFQQVSELLPVPGIDFVGPLPSEIQKVTVFSAGIAVGAKEPEAARTLIKFLTSPAAAPAITKSGMEPVTSAGQK